jgi:hypothetical protein
VKQPSLFDRGPAPHNRTQTSIDAARSLKPTLNGKRLQVYELITHCGDTGLTCDEAERMLGQRHTTVSARINELAHERNGQPAMIRDSGLRRLTSAGRKAIVWVAI